MNNSKVTAQVITITPEMAREMLDLNDENRPARIKNIDKYARDMKAGCWRLNGEPIIMNGTRLLNGQHRLMACIQAGVPFQTLMVRGVDSECFDTIDRHSKRTDGDVLAIMGVKHYNNVAACARLVAGYNVAAGKLTPWSARAVASREWKDVRTFIVEHPLIEASVSWASGRRVKCPFINVTFLATMHYLATSKSIEHGEKFMERVVNGDGLSIGDPRLVLRNALMARENNRAKERSEMLLVKFIHAWNAYRTGRAISKLSFRSDDRMPVML